MAALAIFKAKKGPYDLSKKEAVQALIQVKNDKQSLEQIIKKQETDAQLSHTEIVQLKTQNESQEETIRTEKVARIEIEGRVERLSAVNRCLQTQIDTLTSSLDLRKADIVAITEECNIKDQENDALTGQLAIYQNYQLRVEEWKEQGRNAMRRQNKEIEVRNTRIKDLEEKLDWLLDNADKSVVTAFRDTEAMENRILELEESLEESRINHVTFKNESETKLEAKCAEYDQLFSSKTAEWELAMNDLRASSNAQIEDLKDTEASHKDQILSLETMRTDNTMKLESLGAQITEMESTIQSLTKERTILETLFGSQATPRLIMQECLINEKMIGLAAALDTNESVDTVTVTDKGNWDVALTTVEIPRFVRKFSALFGESEPSNCLSLRTCTGCNVRKFASTVPEDPQWAGMIDFLPQLSQRSCCAGALCNDCLPQHLNFAIESYMWENLGLEQWLGCPVPDCGSVQFGPSFEEFEGWLSNMDDQYSGSARWRYQRAFSVRKALTTVSPTDEAVRVSKGLHKALITAGYMHDLLERSFILNSDSETSPHDEVGILKNADLEDCATPVPIFADFFRRVTEPIECCICAESYSDILIEDEQHWLVTCENFKGKWMMDYVSFPLKSTLKDCEHSIESCKNCYENHLRSDIEVLGRSVCDRLTCPQCSRVLNDVEISAVTTRETRDQYDRFRLLAALAVDENFRWCLREGCQSGEIYEAGDTDIICSVCEFRMCFSHQVPWHTNLTCDQYESQKAHGDPNHQETQAWLQSNTKTCPGATCSVQVQKDGGCFHMTCRSCRHEFCWECLASWSDITRGGQYHRDAHGQGCFFRTQALQPTEMFGNNAQQAAAAARRNNR